MYRKVVKISSVSTGNDIRYAHNISNIDRVISYKGSFIGDASNAYSDTYITPYRGTTTQIRTVNKINIAVDNTENWTGFSLYVLIEYTKTTD